MTTEEKAKAYDEALEKARKRVAVEPQDHTDAILKDIFPELRESEDERMARAINNMLPFIPDEAYANNGVTKEGVLNWLEKQKEQHIPWYDYQKSKEAGYTIVSNDEYEQLIKQKEQKSAWSKEDEKIRNLAIEWAETMYGQFRFVDMGSTDFRKIVAWLKSLRPQPHWKPSEEQIDALETTAHLSNFGCDTGRRNTLLSLCNELKKL